MWLLNAQSFLDGAYAVCRRYFLNDLAPPYIILSHTWMNDQEVLFDEVVNPSSHTESKSGFAKHRYMAKLALEEGIDWFWIDTSCINKDSSAELQETINSMYAIYKQADMCIAYLADVPPEPEHAHSPSRDDVFVAIYSLLYDRDIYLGRQRADEGSQDEWIDFVPLEQRVEAVQALRRQTALQEWTQKLAESRWFTRGWTMQELISPFDVRVYDCTWTIIGSKQQRKFARVLELITRIPLLALVDFDVKAYSVADRMSWASGRQTTRGEDIAYSLLGLFQINMPMLYGEGTERAFARLQRLLIEEGCDNTIFLWMDSDGTRGTYSGALARYPSKFKTSTCYSRSLFPGGSFQADMNTMFIAGGFDFTASLIPMSYLSEYTDNISLYSPPGRDADFELRTLHNNPDLFLFCVTTQGERLLNQEEQFMIAGIILKRLNKGNSQYARVYTAYIVHLKLDWTSQSLCPLLENIRQERIRMRNEINLNERHETNVELYAVMFKGHYFRHDPNGQVSLIRNVMRRPLVRRHLCQQINPRCSQVIVKVDIESFATFFKLPHCAYKDKQHSLVVSFISASSNVGQLRSTARSTGSIINRTLIEPDNSWPHDLGLGSVSKMTDCPDCKISLDGAYFVVVEEDRAMLHIHDARLAVGLSRDDADVTS